MGSTAYGNLESASEALRGDRNFLLNELKPALAATGTTGSALYYMQYYFTYDLKSDSAFIEKFTAC
jgi:hypothetical protein